MDPIPADEIADVWAELDAAAAAGDVQARAFLSVFGPWATQQLASTQQH